MVEFQFVGHAPTVRLFPHRNVRPSVLAANDDLGVAEISLATSRPNPARRFVAPILNRVVSFREYTQLTAAAPVTGHVFHGLAAKLIVVAARRSSNRRLLSAATFAKLLSHAGLLSRLAGGGGSRRHPHLRWAA